MSKKKKCKSRRRIEFWQRVADKQEPHWDFSKLKNGKSIMQDLAMTPSRLKRRYNKHRAKGARNA